MTVNDDESTPLAPLKVDRSATVRWGGDAILLRSGFVPVPRAFLLYASQLPPTGLTPTEVLFIIHLVSFKWDESAPYPSLRRVAERLGISEAYAKKIASSLQRRGFLIKRRRPTESGGFGTNEYYLQPLFDRLADYMRKRPPGAKRGPA